MQYELTYEQCFDLHLWKGHRYLFRGRHQSRMSYKNCQILCDDKNKHAFEYEQTFEYEGRNKSNLLFCTSAATTIATTTSSAAAIKATCHMKIVKY